ELLRGARVQIESAQLVELPEDCYYEFQLIGCQVFTASGEAPGEALGEITEIMHTGAAPLLVIRAARGGASLVPLAAEIRTERDIEKKCITMPPPDGLLDL